MEEWGGRGVVEEWVESIAEGWSVCVSGCGREVGGLVCVGWWREVRKWSVEVCASGCGVGVVRSGRLACASGCVVGVVKR